MDKNINGTHINHRISDIIKNWFLTESIGTFLINNSDGILMINQELKEFVDKIFNDIKSEKYKKYHIVSREFLETYLDNEETVYKLSYKCPFSWLSILHIYYRISK